MNVTRAMQKFHFAMRVYKPILNSCEAAGLFLFCFFLCWFFFPHWGSITTCREGPVLSICPVTSVDNPAGADYRNSRGTRIWSAEDTLALMSGVYLWDMPFPDTKKILFSGIPDLKFCDCWTSCSSPWINLISCLQERRLNYQWSIIITRRGEAVFSFPVLHHRCNKKPKDPAWLHTITSQEEQYFKGLGRGTRKWWQHRGSAFKVSDIVCAVWEMRPWSSGARLFLS